MKEAEKINPKAQQHESRRIWLQAQLNEKVVEARHDASAQKKARDARFARTGEGQCEHAGISR